jgi:sigma-B regulation protein RsbU (phosphoserine phosphatase)
MFPRMPGFLVLSTILCAGLYGASCRAQQGQAASVVRYHFGDDPDGKLGWADPNFDDSSWSIAKDGSVPAAAFYSDGVVWVRARVPASKNATGPLGIALVDLDHGAGVIQVFVNGVPVGQDGQFTPSLAPREAPRELVYGVPGSVAEPGGLAVVALRSWSSPANRDAQWKFRPRVRLRAELKIDSLSTLQTARQADWATALLLVIPQLIPSLLLILLGLALLWPAFESRSRELVLNALYLIFLPMYLLLLALNANHLLSLPVRGDVLLWTIVWAPGFLFAVELIWTLFRLRSRSLRWLLHGCWVFYVLGFDFSALPNRPSTLVTAALFAQNWSLIAYNAITLGAYLWALIVLRRNRAIAVALAVVPLSFFLQIAGLSTIIRIGPINFDWFSLGFLCVGLTITTKLLRDAVAAWRSRDELRVEFDAAREVQQQLVAPAVDLPGFKIESAYFPAKQVGGDFFRVVPDPDGSVLIVVGDVSGKGLRAAMTVSAIIGALRTMPVLTPGRVLAALNRGLVGQVSGFVTCCVALVSSNGTMTLANAGNPAPYRNGEEMAVEPGLPLGLLAEVSYTETQYQIAPGDQLIFVSDGVVEATNAQGELYGFERTRAVSTESARRIAETAQQFGQEDDITVLSLSLVGG